MASAMADPTNEVIHMARITRVISDITGKEADASELIKLTIRKHPAVVEPKQLDMLDGEIEGLKGAPELVICEVEGVTIYAMHKDFQKVIPDEKVVEAQGTRGRRRGTSPKSA